MGRFARDRAALAAEALTTNSSVVTAIANDYGFAEIFGRRHYGSISGAMALGANGARAVAPVGASLLMIAFGGYDVLFRVLAAALALVGFAVLAFDARPRADAGGER